MAKQKALRLLRIVAFIAYCVYIVWVAIISRKPNGIHHADLRFMWSYRELFTGDPHGKADVIQNLQNIVFFVPYGVLVPVDDGKSVLITACIFSVLIELIQYIGGFGLAELDDVICNTLGAIMGFLLWIRLKRLVVKT